LDAWKLMIKKNVWLLVVCDAKDYMKLVGLVSERDIIGSIVSGGSLHSQVENVGTRQIVTVNANSDVAEAAKVMNKHRIRHVVVLDERASLLGVVSMRNLVSMLR